MRKGCLSVAFQSRKAAPRISAYKCFAQQNLGDGGLRLPSFFKSGSHETPRFHGLGDIIEGYTMEEIPR